MLSLAALRYRNVLAEHGGPVERIEEGHFPIFGRPVVQASVYLRPGLTEKRALSIYSDADGTGTHPTAGVARHIAISEALERWAFYTVSVSKEAADYGFDIDPSSNGMAAFPGLRQRSARRKALLEAVERFCLIAWWEGMIAGQLRETDWPGVSAVAIEGPFGGVTVIAFARTEHGGYAYGYAAEESFGAACERAVIELARHECVLRFWWLAFIAGQRGLPTHLFERRCLFFASEEGHGLFLQRLHEGTQRSLPEPIVVCDRAIPGPWSSYATVWRFALRPPTEGFLREGETYFFW